jgi:hypothetical protein
MPAPAVLPSGVSAMLQRTAPFANVEDVASLETYLDERHGRDRAQRLKQLPRERRERLADSAHLRDEPRSGLTHRREHRPL